MSQKRHSRHTDDSTMQNKLAADLKAQGHRLKGLARTLKETTRELKGVAKFISKTAKAVAKMSKSPALPPRLPSKPRVQKPAPKRRRQVKRTLATVIRPVVAQVPQETGGTPGTNVVQ